MCCHCCGNYHRGDSEHLIDFQIFVSGIASQNSTGSYEVESNQHEVPSKEAIPGMWEVGTLQPWPTLILNCGVVLLSPCLTKLYRCVVEIHRGCGLRKCPPPPILTPHVTHTNH